MCEKKNIVFEVKQGFKFLCLFDFFMCDTYEEKIIWGLEISFYSWVAYLDGL